MKNILKDTTGDTYFWFYEGIAGLILAEPSQGAFFEWILEQISLDARILEGNFRGFFLNKPLKIWLRNPW